MKLKLAAFLFALCALVSFASSPKSMVGQNLPKLDVDFVKDAPKIDGKPVILEFWATWCPPCRQSIPHMNEIYKKFKDKGLVIIGVTEEDNSTITQFTKKNPINYSAGTDRGGKLNKAFAIEGIPHAVIADKTGKIVWEGHPMELKESDIEAVLK